MARRDRFVVEDFILHRTTPDHPKILRLVAQAGEAAFRCWCRLIAVFCDGGPGGDYSGRFVDWDDDRIEMAAAWIGDPGTFVKALRASRLLDTDTTTGIMSLHDFADNQPHVAGTPERVESAREKGARGGAQSVETRTKRYGSAQPKRPGSGDPKQAGSDPPKQPGQPARSSPVNPPEAPSPSPSPSPIPSPGLRGESPLPPKAKDPPKVPPTDPFGTGLPHTRQRPTPVAQVLSAWARIFKRVTGEDHTEDAGTSGDLERLLQQHEPGKLILRMTNYEAHHKAGTFACETFTLRQLIRDFDKFAAPPRPKAPPGLSKLPDLEANAREAYEFLKRREDEDKAKAAGLLEAANGDG